MTLPSPMNELIELHEHRWTAVLAALTTLLIIAGCVSAPVLAVLFLMGAL